MDGRVTPALEYVSLREELLAAKRYVFERPLIIVALGAAALGGGSGAYVVFLPPLLAGLLIFSLWLTVNRLKSAARIAAYIQWVLEGEGRESWIGWESALREQRLWMQRTKKEVRRKMIAEKFGESGIPRANLFYPAIYSLHGGLLVLVVAASVALCIVRVGGPSLISLVVTVGLAILFLGYMMRWSPRDLGNLIEKNRLIWQEVLKSPASKTGTRDTSLEETP